jgi:predicted GNAT superfamily acetyltransferase
MKTASLSPTAATGIAGVRSAQEAAAAAIHRAGIEVRTVDDLGELALASELWQTIWKRDGEAPVSRDLLRALSHAGNYLAGAFRDGSLIGALLGFYSGHDRPDQMHSHILGVDPEARARGVGFALKMHQRAWALERGLERITWTFDPLVRNNAYFNLAKLGTLGAEYLVNFYGSMRDAINTHEDSDRLLVTWDLRTPRVERAATGSALEVDARTSAAATVALKSDSSGRPELTGRSGDIELCQIPLDIVSLRQSAPDVARQWRVALRETMVSAFRGGLVASGMNREGWYLLAPRQREDLG